MLIYHKKSKGKQNRLSRLAIALVAAALVAVLGYQTVKLQRKNDEYSQRLAAIERQLEQEESRAEELKQRQIYVQTDQFIEQEAKDKLGMINPNEILLKPQN